MKRVAFIPIIFAWIILVCIVCGWMVTQQEKEDVQGAYVGGVLLGSDTYTIDKRPSGSFLTRISKEGKAMASKEAKTFEYESFEAVTRGNGTLSVLLSRENQFAGGKTYCIYELSEDMAPLRHTQAFLMDSGLLFSSMVEDGDSLYISAVEEDRRGIQLFTFSKSDMESVEAAENKEEAEAGAGSATGKKVVLSAERIKFEDEQAEVADARYTLYASGKRMFAEGYYMSGALYGWQDDEKPQTVARVDTDIKTTYLRAKLSFRDVMRRHPVTVLACIGYGAAGLLVLLLFLILGSRRVRYANLALRLAVLALILGGLFLAGYSRIDRALCASELELVSGQAKDFAKRYAESALVSKTPEQFYDSKAYFTIRRWANVSLDDMVLFAVENSTKTVTDIILSKSCHNFAAREQFYDSVPFEVAESAVKTGTAERVFTFQGQKYLISAISLQKTSGIPYVVAAIDRYEGVPEGTVRGFGGFLAAILCLFAAAMIIQLLVGRRELGVLCRALASVSIDGQPVRYPARVPGYLKKHWDAVSEIEKRFKTASYSVYQTYQAYYRFAPKKIEEILQKGSIGEVQCGDMIRFEGTEAILSFSTKFRQSHEGIRKMNDLLALMESHREAHRGIFISSDMGMRRAKLLFQQDVRHTAGFGTDFLDEAQGVWEEEKMPAAVILHYNAYDYGIVGTEGQSMAFLDSMETRVLEKFADWFFEKGIRLVITGEVAKRENIPGKLRYLGFIQETEKKIDLYEVLDANPADVRSAKLRNLEKYEQALELFAGQDFYLARNMFTTILRELPDDAIVKWYLFECERHLDEPMEREPLQLVLDSES